MTIRWALLGTGRHARRSVIAALKSAAGGELVAVMSRDAARGDAFAREHGIAKRYTSLDALLGDPAIDAIYDATPDGLHAQHAIAAAAAGKHALIEKPLAISVSEGAAAIEAGRRRGVTLGVVFNQRHEAAHQEARRMVLAGAIGDVVLASVSIPLRPVPGAAAPPAESWRGDPKMRPGGIVWGIGDHAYDTLAYLLGQEIDEVAAFGDGTRLDPPNERSAGMLLRLSRGAIGYASSSARTPFARRPFELHGTAGSLFIENSYTYLTGAGADPEPQITSITAAGSRIQRFAPSDCFRLEIERFNRAIEGRDRPMTTASEGLRAVAVGVAIYDAIRNRRTAKVAAFLPEPL